MLAVNLDSYTYSITTKGDEAQLVIKDNETDFIYLKQRLKVPGYELRVKSLSTASVWPRGDPRNDALVFNIEYDEIATSHEQLRQTDDFLKHAEFVCEGTGEPSQVLAGTAFRQNGGSKYVCLLNFHEYAAPAVNFNFMLKLYSGYGAKYFAIHN